MIKLVPVISIHDLKEELRQIYTDSFPSIERRDWQELIKLLNHPNFKLNQVFNDQELIGLISIWNLPDFDFIEHFAIHESVRGNGFGTSILKKVIDNKSTRIVVEVEEPFTQPARRRIAFYDRLGFRICDDIYYQPPYSPNNTKVKMLLMSFPAKLNSKDFEDIKTRIYQLVYSQKIVL